MHYFGKPSFTKIKLEYICIICRLLINDIKLVLKVSWDWNYFIFICLFYDFIYLIFDKKVINEKFILPNDSNHKIYPLNTGVLL